MIVALVIIAAIALLFGFFNALEGEKETSAFYMIFCFLMLLSAGLYQHIYPELKLQLPDDHKRITWNKNQPDTLIGYHSGDTLIIKFR